MQLRFIALLLIGLLGCPYGVVHAQEPAPFPDMEHSWYLYRDAVSVLKDLTVIDGYSDGTFRPQHTINRAEFLKIVFAAKGSEGGAEGGDCFTDVPHGAWFAPYVCTAKRRNIALGYPDGSFKPEQEVNWAEAIALITRAYGWDIDQRDGVRWYEPFVDALDRRDVLAEHSYVPWKPLTRERAADLVYRMIQFERGLTFESSPGCSGGDGRIPDSITVNGVERSFLSSVPRSARIGDPTPLLIAFHGRTNSNAQVQAYMHFERQADDMIVVYPEGLPNGNGYTWYNDGVLDTALYDTLVEEIGKHLCVDMEQLYVAGHSLGAWMANSIACRRGGVVRGSGTVGGDGISTSCTGPTAAFIAHNPDDTLSPFSGAERIRKTRSDENACAWETTPAAPQSLLCVSQKGCQGGNDIVWCPHEIDTERGAYYPHTWPDGATDGIVSFFERLE